MDITFTKMHGLGNDFVVIESQHLPPNINLSKLAAFLCNRNFGIGSDGLIIIAPPSQKALTQEPKADLQFIFYNSDGSQAEMCGNGIRCFGLYAVDKKLINQTTFNVESLAGLMVPQVNSNGTVTVDMGPPILEPAQVPFNGTNNTVSVLNQTIPVHPVSMGNPHCIIFQEDLPTPLDPATFGPAIEVHPSFPAKTNVEFINTLDRNTLKVTVWERGCGFTLACGTGACASAVAGILAGKVESDVEIQLPGGSLTIAWKGSPTDHVYMTGPASYVFTGTISIDEGQF